MPGIMAVAPALGVLGSSLATLSIGFSLKPRSLTTSIKGTNHAQYIGSCIALILSSFAVSRIEGSIRIGAWILTLALIPLVVQFLFRLLTGDLDSLSAKPNVIPGYSGYAIRRWGARTLDGLVCWFLADKLFLLLLPYYIPMMWSKGLDLSRLPGSVHYSLFLCIVFIIYEFIPVALCGQTLGKFLCRIQVVSARTGVAPGWRSSCFRFLGICVVPLALAVVGMEVLQISKALLVLTSSMLGLMLVGHLHPREQGLQDLVARTVVSRVV